MKNSTIVLGILIGCLFVLMGVVGLYFERGQQEQIEQLRIELEDGKKLREQENMSAIIYLNEIAEVADNAWLRCEECRLECGGQ